METDILRAMLHGIVPPLELWPEHNSRSFALAYLQRLGTSGISSLESSVRGCGAQGMNLDTFLQCSVRCLAMAGTLPGACAFPWQRRRFDNVKNDEGESRTAPPAQQQQQQLHLELEQRQ